jgi:hypothetical protein
MPNERMLWYAEPLLRGPHGATAAAAMVYFFTDGPDAAAGKEQRKLATVEAVSLSAR